MTAPRHQIRRQILEVTVQDHEAAWRLQTELGRIHAQRLEALIDRCCTQLGAPDRLQRIALVEVDLGRLDPDHLERDLVDKLGPLLQEALAARIREEDEKSALRGSDPEVISRLELVAFFARTGTLPWWADTTRPRLLDEALGLLLQRAARPFAALIRALERERGALTRIVRHGHDARLWALFDALVASSQADLPSMPVELGALLRAYRAVAGATPVGFRACVWTGALRTACVEESPSDGRVGFWRDALARIALEAGVPLKSLLAGLHAPLGPSPSAWPGALGAVGQSLGVGALGAVGQSPGAGVERPVRQTQREAPSRDPGAAAADEELSVDPAYGDSDEVYADHAGQSPGAGVERPVRQTQREAPSRDPGARAADEELSVDPAYGDSDEAYVDNAGLVVLWPFLGHLFERLGLMADGQIADQRALHRAAGLLQHLCTGDLEPAEHQLPLTRVLCGMRRTEVFDFGPPVTEAEAEECIHLLTAAIERAPILRDMSIAGFRGSFLIRKGALGVRDGAWFLRVERASHDVVLDRFPWGMSWVKLPWMEAPLCVEW
ncbi:contractile injection system tape measure protein [Sorangium sp. So ce887]|uniref:contractile injection system tape measure protein n=1 Tax=Sorangium sp. So ce887 TaxID=3133324 RepID=UPI003F6298F1